MALRLGLGLGLSGGVSFSPLSLFAASEPGLWYDPSDISTLFQDAAGTTPVTAAGQSVGLVLDKRLGLVLGANRVINGDFSSGTTGWTASNATLSTSNGELVITSTGGGYPSATQSFTVTNQRTYRVSVTQRRGTSPNAAAIVCQNMSSINISAVYTNATTNSVTTVFYFVASVSPMQITLFQNAGATTAGQTTIVDNVTFEEVPGNHATQSTTLSRPTYQVDSNGRGYLSFDGSDDFLVTPTITPGTDKAQVFAGVRKLSDAVRGMVVESGSGGTTNAILLNAPTGSLSGYGFGSFGSLITAQASTTSPAAPSTNVLTGIGDIVADTAVLRINGTQAASSTADQGTGNYLAYPAYIGRRGGTSLPFNGRIYSLITRFGANLTADQIAQTEAWVNSKTGAY